MACNYSLQNMISIGRHLSTWTQGMIRELEIGGENFQNNFFPFSCGHFSGEEKIFMFSGNVISSFSWVLSNYVTKCIPFFIYSAWLNNHATSLLPVSSQLWFLSSQVAKIDHTNRSQADIQLFHSCYGYITHIPSVLCCVYN